MEKAQRFNDYRKNKMKSQYNRPTGNCRQCKWTAYPGNKNEKYKCEHPNPGSCCNKYNLDGLNRQHEAELKLVASTSKSSPCGQEAEARIRDKVLPRSAET